jgi:UTP--glucose-1-phosphate uridylyltransferase
MEITKAIITAAARSQHTLPLQSVVDRDGEPKSALRIIIEETLSAGIEEIGVVITPGDADAFRAAAGPHAGRLQFFEQSQPRGFGHAVLAGHPFVDDSPFLLVGDHLYVTQESRSCARQLIDVATTHGCAVSAVQGTHESKLPYYGAVGGRRLHGQSGLYEITEVIEKPTPTEAEQRLLVPGLRAGHYLCYFGMHVLTPLVMDWLAHAAASSPDPVQLTPALDHLARRERYLAFETRGRRYDIGHRFGLLHAQLAIALEGRHRDEVLHLILELLASRDLNRPA